MFKKFKERLTEVSEEVKKDPRFQNSIKLAQDTIGGATIAKSPSKESLQSDVAGNNNGGGGSNNTDHFFSLGEVDEDSAASPVNQSSPNKESGDFQPVDLMSTSTPNRVRRGSSG